MLCKNEFVINKQHFFYQKNKSFEVHRNNYQYDIFAPKWVNIIFYQRKKRCEIISQYIMVQKYDHNHRIYFQGVFQPKNQLKFQFEQIYQIKEKAKSKKKKIKM